MNGLGKKTTIESNLVKLKIDLMEYPVDVLSFS